VVLRVVKGVILFKTKHSHASVLPGSCSAWMMNVTAFPFLQVQKQDMQAAELFASQCLNLDDEQCMVSVASISASASEDNFNSQPQTCMGDDHVLPLVGRGPRQCSRESGGIHGDVTRRAPFRPVLVLQSSRHYPDRAGIRVAPTSSYRGKQCHGDRVDFTQLTSMRRSLSCAST
jgi:hypothetical protein